MNYKIIENKRPIRICFLGCGNITSRHAKTVLKVGHNIETGFASRDKNKSDNYLNKYNGSKSYGSYDEAVSDDWADVIMICTPPKYHLEWAEQALNNNTHIILEKPPLLKSEDFDLLHKISAPKGLHVLVAENYFYKPLRKKLIDVINSGVIGEPKFIHISAAKNQDVDDWRGNSDEVGYGALYEGGIHWISFMNNLGYEVEQSSGFLPSGQDKLERSVQVSMKTKDGPVINLIYSWEVNALFKGLRISRVFGTKGSIRWESNGIFMWVRGQSWRMKIPGLKDIGGFQTMFKDFFNALRSGQEAEYNWEKAKLDLKTIEDIYSSV